MSALTRFAPELVAAAALCLFQTGQAGGDGARPQEQRAPFPYHAEEVRFAGASADVELAGTLTLPEAEGPAPAVLLVQGASPFDRDETAFGHKPFLVLADALTRAGCVVLRLDDRGIGGSSGQKLESGLAELEADVERGLDFLAELTEVDARRIGLIGHSQGALLACGVAARREDVAFVALLGATALPVAELLAFQKALDGDGTLELNRRLLDGLRAAVQGKAPAADDAQRALEAWERELAGCDAAERELGALFVSSMRCQLPVWLGPRMMRELLWHDPAPALAALRCPVLAITGELDQGRAAENPNLPALVAALERGANPHYEILKLPRLNHMLQTAERGDPQEIAELQETLAPAVLDALVAWVGRQR